MVWTHPIPKDVGDVLDLPFAILSLCQLPQRTHAPIFIGTNSAYASRSPAVDVGLQHTTNDIDILALVDKDSAWTSPILEDDAVWVSRTICITRVGRDKSNIRDSGGLHEHEIVNGAAVNK